MENKGFAGVEDSGNMQTAGPDDVFPIDTSDARGDHPRTPSEKSAHTGGTEKHPQVRRTSSVVWAGKGSLKYRRKSR